MLNKAELADAILREYELVVIRIEIALTVKPLSSPKGWLGRVTKANALFAAYIRLSGVSYSVYARHLNVSQTLPFGWAMRGIREAQQSGIACSYEDLQGRADTTHVFPAEEINRHHEMMARFKNSIKTLA